MTRTITRDTREPVAVDDPYAPIIADLRAAMAAIKCASSERLRRMGVSMAQLSILFTIQREGEVTMSQVADGLGVSLSNATGLIDRIEERGFVERIRVAEDRRIVLVRLTPAGTRMLDEVDALSDDLFRRVLGRLDRSQLPGVAQTMAALREAVVDATTPEGWDRHALSTSAPRSPTTI